MIYMWHYGINLGIVGMLPILELIAYQDQAIEVQAAPVHGVEGVAWMRALVLVDESQWVHLGKVYLDNGRDHDLVQW